MPASSNSSERAPAGGARPEAPIERWGPPSPFLLRAVAVAAFAALAGELAARALPGSRSGIDWMIPPSFTIAKVLGQFTALLGSVELVLLVVTTLSEGALPLVYRMLIVPGAAGVLMLVMLASTGVLEAPASLVVGGCALSLAAASAAQSVRSPASRAQGLVFAAVALGGALHLAARSIGVQGEHPRLPLVQGLATAAHLFDLLALVIVAARFTSERGRTGRLVLGAGFLLSLVLAWNGLRGTLESASTAQVLVSRALSELTAFPQPFAPVASRYALEAFAVLLAGVVILYPAALSLGALSAALAVLPRLGADVPLCALVLSVGALCSPLASLVPVRRGAERGDKLPGVSIESHAAHGE